MSGEPQVSGAWNRASVNRAGAAPFAVLNWWLLRFVWPHRGPVEWLWNSTYQAITRPRTNRDTVAAELKTVKDDVGTLKEKIPNVKIETK